MYNASFGSQAFHEDDGSHKRPTRGTSKQGMHVPGKGEQHHSRQRRPMSNNPLGLGSLPATFLRRAQLGPSPII